MSAFDPVWLTLLIAAFFAGFVDAVAGGGGLIQVPALFAALPRESPATLFGTNKLASIFGTLSAARRYVRAVTLPWRLVLPAAGAAFLFSFLGAAVVAWLPKDVVRPLVLVLLVAVAVYTWSKPDFGASKRSPRVAAEHLVAVAILVGALLGFYDGFFGPGAGSFMIFAFVRFFGMDFLHASAAAKILNASTNAGALLLFAPTNHVLWTLGFGMALCNIAGSRLGSKLAIKHGSGFVRAVFLLMTSLLIVKIAWDTWGTP
ncbi:TSUP family transporter [Sulfuricystis multivorans]|uniref:TSUP family transporter n=1 Tax=Sulfuricystis multivorans TaxID=2211108 RepID=UPI000F84ACCD|nr:TSUP family transporter [Sulfuricystis multivorans]